MDPPPVVPPPSCPHHVQEVELRQFNLVRTTVMKSTSESLSLPETSNGRAAGGNCVVVRRGGEQPEADPRSQTQVNPIRHAIAASLLGSGEACRMSGDRSGRHSSSAVRNGLLGVAGVRTRGRFHDGPLRPVRAGSRASGAGAGVRAVIVARKRGNACGAKGGRKVERTRP